MIKKRTGRAAKIILWALCIIWLFIIVWESSETGAETANTSYRVAECVAALLKLPSSSTPGLDHFLRTSMHFVNFFVLGGLAYAAAYVTWQGKRHLILWVIFICGIIAVLDEVKKVFIAGRHLSWAEAGLNGLGVLAGVFIIQLCIWLKNRKKT